jgi:high-affinity iron transporter
VLQTFVITPREGIEAFLIVAIVLACLSSIGRGRLSGAVCWGTGAAVLASAGAGFLFSRAENKPLWEGAMGATVLVSTMVAYMWRRAPMMGSEVNARLDAEATKTEAAAWGCSRSPCP